MSYDFVIAALTFSIVMVLFSLVKDFIIVPRFDPSKETLKRLNKRWTYSFVLGFILLYLIYGRGSPW
tara:strand:+ start:1715 stop:1915 length:201 start_codon:yes stop_codon:yes gene_type:complete